MGSGNEEGVLTQPGKASRCCGVQQKLYFQHETLLQKDMGCDLIPGGRWSPEVANRAQIACRKPSWGARLKYCSVQLHPHSLSLKFYWCVCKNICQSLQCCNATQGLLCQPTVAVLLQTASLQSHPMKYDGLSEIYFASLDWLISAPSKSDSFNHHQLLLSLCSDSCCATLFTTETFQIYCI